MYKVVADVPATAPREGGGLFEKVEFWVTHSQLRHGIDTARTIGAIGKECCTGLAPRSTME